MATLKLVIEKGPREGETLEYTTHSVVKIGRLVRGNTIAIKDSGISSKHICIKFDDELNEWTLSDLDSSNGTILNGQNLTPNVPSGLKDGDCIKIGELTSIIVRIGVQSQRREEISGAEAASVVESVNLGETVAEQKRSLRSRAKKAVVVKEVEILSSRRTLRSSKKEEKVNFIPTLNQIPENVNADVSETTDVSVPKNTRGRRKKLPVQPVEKSDLDETQPAAIVVAIDGRSTRRGRKRLPLGNAESIGNEVELNDVKKSVIVDEGNKATSDISLVENVESGGMEENLNTNNESTQDDHEKPDDDRWSDLEKMTLGDFFDYLEVHLPKEIHEKTEKIISDLEEKTRKCHEFRLQKNEKGKGSLAMD